MTSSEHDPPSPSTAEDSDVATGQRPALSILERTRWIILAAVAGLLTAVICVVSVVAISSTGRLPRMTPEDFEAARARWAANPMSDYDVQILVVARDHDHYEVQVRGGQVVGATHNGVEIRQVRSRGTWCVEGMFDTINSDVENLRTWQAGEADASTPQVTLHGLFDDERGFPIRYLRTEKRRFTNDYEVSWEVTLAPTGN